MATVERGCPVIWDRRLARRLAPEERPRTLVYPAIVRNTGLIAERPDPAVSSKQLTFGHINIRSLTPKLDDVRLIIRQNKLDALCISETWLTNEVSSDILLFAGYQVFREDRKKAKPGQRRIRGGGVAIVLRDDITASKLKMSPPKDSRLESLWLMVAAPGGQSAVLGATYRPPGEPVTPDIDALRNQLLEVSRHGKPVYLLGDINLDLIRPEKPQVAQYITMLQELNFIQLIQDPTHPGEPSLIDHVVTNMTSITHRAAAVVQTHVSDHDLIIVNAPLPRPKRKPRELMTRSTRDVNYDHLCLDLLQSNWSRLYDSDATSIDDLFTTFLEIWNAAVDQHCPLKSVKLRHPDRPWLTINDDLRKLQAQRDAARRRRDAVRTIESENEYSSLKKEFRRRIAAARVEYFSAPSTATEMWKELRKHALGPSQSTGPGDVPDAAAANRFNSYFAGVGPRITVPPATLPELSDALKRMSGSRATGDDGVSLHLIRRCFPVVGPHVLRVINASIITGRVPAAWKHARVMPIFNETFGSAASSTISAARRRAALSKLAAEQGQRAAAAKAELTRQEAETQAERARQEAETQAERARQEAETQAERARQEAETQAERARQEAELARQRAALEAQQLADEAERRQLELELLEEEEHGHQSSAVDRQALARPAAAAPSEPAAQPREPLRPGDRSSRTRDWVEQSSQYGQLCLHYDADISAATNVTAVISKLPAALALKWGEHAVHSDLVRPTLADLDSWLRRYVAAGRSLTTAAAEQLLIGGRDR
ncbi:hypothetical protein FJT64_025623 [Amphibalanus amphitrite]|uniref:Endonuclease/exonuclease/phosphatase domain-containing protein n=1 Tax=Amphibalanus amphitrite TaxID=1232801 RepID=A0A6A4WK15_AMPAM|nr:hypothetical protein FJT64_025623 [Amphibalanus amphitrite]